MLNIPLLRKKTIDNLACYENNKLVCYVCGSTEFTFVEILWEKLIKEWKLSEHEVRYINRQQGLACKNCKSNLRSIALAKGIVNAFSFPGTLDEFVKSDEFSQLRVLEINNAGNLTHFLKLLNNHKLISYPEYDMTKLNIKTSHFDLIVHSDTLEHIEDPISALSECKRVLRHSGKCIFTIPIIVGRLTKDRNGLKPSYHGSEKQKSNDLIVHTEFGADFWSYILKSGFSQVAIHCIEYPAGISIEATY